MERLAHRQPVDYKSAAFGYPIVKSPRDAIGLVRLPINSMAIGQARLVHDGCNERRAHPATSRFMASEEILKIADVGDRRGAAMKQVMNESNQLSVHFSDQRMYRLGLVEEAIPSKHCHCWRKAGGADSAIEFIVAVPELQPLFEVFRDDLADGKSRVHWDGSSGSRVSCVKAICHLPFSCIQKWVMRSRLA